MNRLAYHDAIGRNRRGLVASPDGLGNPTPTDSNARFPVSHVAPLGLRCVWCMRCAINGRF